MKQYLDLLRTVLLEGQERSDRTGVGTYSIFGTQTRYDLRQGFPLVTTREINFDVVVKELLWFLRGETNISTLGSKIWDEWADANGDLGPIYGKQWRDCGGVDQISNLVDGMEKDPFSRRHIVSAWNPVDLPNMKLAPCHTMFQVYMTPGSIDLQLYQRSADLAIGVPFNIASYSLLLHMLGRAFDKQPRYFIHTIGDAHIYKNHIPGVLEQLRQPVRLLPTVRVEIHDRRWSPEAFKNKSAWTTDNIDARVWGYRSGAKIKFPVAV